MKLFTEMQFVVPEPLPDAETEPGVFRFDAFLSEADVVNKNRRLYPYSVLSGAVNEALTSLNRRPGTVDHPHPDQPLSISDNGILWENLRFDGNRLIGTGRIIETQKGLDLKANIKAGVAVGFSTRGYGVTESREAGGQKWNEMTSFTLETIDAVVNPSSVDARVISYVGEAEEADMELTKELIQELNDAKVAAALLTPRAESAEAAKAAADARIVALETELAGVKAELVTANATVAALEAEKAGDPAAVRLAELTADDLFGAAIRAEVEAVLTATGAVATVESVEAMVARFRPMVEGIAAAGNNGAKPRGQVDEADVEPKIAPERAAQLAAMGL